MNATALGKLFLVPTPLDFLCDTQVPLSQVLPLATVQTASQIDHWVVENAKSARAFLKRVDAHVPLSKTIQDNTITELPREVHKKGDHTGTFDAKPMLQAALAGQNVGLVSEAGMPAVADPGPCEIRPLLRSPEPHRRQLESPPGWRTRRWRRSARSCPSRQGAAPLPRPPAGRRHPPQAPSGQGRRSRRSPRPASRASPSARARRVPPRRERTPDSPVVFGVCARVVGGVKGALRARLRARGLTSVFSYSTAAPRA